MDKTGRSLRAAALDAPVTNGDILIVERQVILRLLEGIQRSPPSSACSTTPPRDQHRQRLDRSLAAADTNVLERRLSSRYFVGSRANRHAPDRLRPRSRS